MRFLVIFALFLGAAMAVPSNPTRIVGGSPTTIDNYPYMSNMQYYWILWWLQSCGGSLLSNNIILSAAHCYCGDVPSEWRVRLGSSFASSGGVLHSVERLILHENYDDDTYDNDIALVRLSSSAVYTNVIQPARIPSTTYVLNDGAVVTTMGWGRLNPGGSSPEQLQHVDVNIINHELCTERYDYLKTQPNFEDWPVVTDNMLCAGILDVGGKDACQGDSGGPLAHNGDIIVGVTSWGYSCADEYYPGVNARVSRYTDWILANAV